MCVCALVRIVSPTCIGVYCTYKSHTSTVNIEASFTLTYTATDTFTHGHDASIDVSEYLYFWKKELDFLRVYFVNRHTHIHIHAYTCTHFTYIHTRIHTYTTYPAVYKLRSGPPARRANIRASISKQYFDAAVLLKVYFVPHLTIIIRSEFNICMRMHIHSSPSFIHSFVHI